MRTALISVARRTAVAVAGVATVAVGLVLLVLPGPGLLIVFAGLGLLATEFGWASVLLLRTQATGRQAWRRARRGAGRDRVGEAAPSSW